uniref:BTB domain-containing protein n=1 Tax=Tetranychus urticae TaxID=32264 RepID=T1KW94_TETUR
MDVQEDASSLLLSTYKTGKWSDVTIMNGDKKYRLHKNILCTAIPYFDKMFSSEFSESTSEVINLDHNPDVFDLIIEWAYCSKIKISKENAVDLFHLADYMNIPKLTTVCLNFLWNNFSDYPFIDVGHWINQISTEEVNNFLDRYICSNFWDIVHTDSFLEYDVDTVAYMISFFDLDIDNEMQVFDAIIKWIEKRVERKSHLSKLLRKVHWVEINKVQFINRIDKLSWTLHDRTRPVIMAAIELMFYKSLKKMKSIDVVFGPRYASDSFHYAIRRKTDSSIEADNFNGDYGKIIFSENRSLPPANFGDSHITEHCMDSDVIIRIDWKNKTYRKVHFWKGERLIEFAHLPDGNTTSQSTVTLTKYKGGLCLSIIATSGSYNQNYYNSYTEYKSQLTIANCTSSEDMFKVVASHEIVTKEPIKRLKSTTLRDLLVIFVDCSLILSYDFQQKIFKEHKNDLNGRSLCFLHYRHFGPRLLIFNNDGNQSRQGFHADSGELSCLADPHEPYAGIESEPNLFGFLSLEAGHHANMSDLQSEPNKNIIYK